MGHSGTSWLCADGHRDILWGGAGLRKDGSATGVQRRPGRSLSDLTWSPTPGTVTLAEAVRYRAWYVGATYRGTIGATRHTEPDAGRGRASARLVDKTGGNRVALFGRYAAGAGEHLAGVRQDVVAGPG